ncbi:MAG: 1,4-beta-D-glucan glucohydrolase [Candidatus Anoxychlamydiales bacterium]|nr:1,4-beta-D-glucan glucohydrolase [Candidatus Anoxychlamydiales bacterium]
MSSMAVNVLKRFESCFYPAEDKITLGKDKKPSPSYLSTQKKITYFSSNLFKAMACLLALPISISVSICVSLANRVYSVFRPRSKNLDKDELDASSDDGMYELPKDIGFADSLFQSCGLGSEHSKPSFDGRSNWDRWLTQEHIEVKKDQKFDDFFVNYLDDPKPLIKILKDMNATSYRFSLERSIIEPKRGKPDFKAIGKYVNFCKELKENNIEPWVTLEHFVQPDWFAESRGFENEENIDGFVEYSEYVIHRLKDHVTNFMTFNEPSAYIFQTYIREVFPDIKGRGNKFFRAAIALRNILITHIKVYQTIKAKYPDIQIGIVHQFLKFMPFNKNNPIERLVCYYYSLITHYATYNFFKTKRFSFQIPFLANVKFEAEKDQKLTDFIGFQCYGYPLVKAGTNGGKTYPGYKVTNFSIPRLRFGFTFGSVCEENSKMMSFGMRYHPEALEDALTEASDLKIPIAITETGCDAKIQHWGEKTFEIDEKTQKEYFEKIFQIIQKFKKKLPLKGLFFWTLLRGHLEWDRGNNTSLGLVEIQKDPSNHTIKSYRLSLAAEYIKQVFQNANFYRDKKVA